MKDNSSSQAKSAEQPIRQPYHPPTLTKFGAVTELTSGGSGANGETGPLPDSRRA